MQKSSARNVDVFCNGTRSNGHKSMNYCSICNKYKQGRNEF